jgi:hypothetical protein
MQAPACLLHHDASITHRFSRLCLLSWLQKDVAAHCRYQGVPTVRPAAASARDAGRRASHAANGCHAPAPAPRPCLPSRPARGAEPKHDCGARDFRGPAKSAHGSARKRSGRGGGRAARRCHIPAGILPATAAGLCCVRARQTQVRWLASVLQASSSPPAGRGWHASTGRRRWPAGPCGRRARDRKCGN